MNRTLRPHATASVAVFLALAIWGCGADQRNPLRPSPMLHGGTSHALSPQSLASDEATRDESENSGDASEHRGHGFYPLALGNQWNYRTRFKVTVTDDESGKSTTDVIDGTLEKRLTSIQPFQGHDYVEETNRGHQDGDDDQMLMSIFFRQDRSGLYEFEPPPATGVRGIAHSPASGVLRNLRDPRAALLRHAFGPRASDESITRLLERVERALGAGYLIGGTHARPGGPLAHELTRLSYPLRPGAHWLIRDDPLFESTVENIGLVEVPAGRFLVARIRIDSEFFGPNDRVYVWYGHRGFIKLSAHIESDVTDSYGTRVGLAVSESGQDLVDLQLQRRFDYRPQPGALSQVDP